MRAKDIYPGHKQNRVTILKKVKKPKHVKQRGTYWKYKCTCGNERICHATAIVRNLKSCGCLSNLKKFKTNSIKDYRYLYNVWKAMHYRCYKPNNKNYKTYGLLGIKVCKKWHDFSHFYNDMHPSYVRGLTLERKNIDKDYSFGNCIWIPNKDQAKNRRSSLAYRKRTGYIWEFKKAT